MAMSSLFSVLPEGCIANIISLTSPKDACRAASISSVFRSAAESDTVWDRFIPLDYEQLVSPSDLPLVFSTKKQLYVRICDYPQFLDGGKLVYLLIRSTGKKYYMLSARKLEIAWGDAPIHWRWKSIPTSRFAEVAELESICWLEIRATFKARMLSPNTRYAAYLVFRLSDTNYGLHSCSKASVKFVRENGTVHKKGETTSLYVVPPKRRREIGRRRWVRPPPVNIDGRLPVRRRSDCCFQLELAEFYIGQGDESCDVQIQFSETERLNWKRGLIVEGIELRSKESS